MHAESTWSSHPIRIAASESPVLPPIPHHHHLEGSSRHEHRIKKCKRQQVPKQVKNEGTPHLGQPWIQHRRHRIASSPARNPSRHDHATSSETAISRHQEQTFFFSSIRIKHCISACAKYLQQPRNYDPRRSILREKPESTSQLVASQQSTIHYTSKRSSNNT